MDGQGRKLLLQGEGDGVVLGVPLAMGVCDVVVADVDAGHGGRFRRLWAAFLSYTVGDVLSGDLHHFLVICDVAGLVPIGRLVAEGEGGDDGQRPGYGGGFGGLGGESGEEDDRCDGDADADDSCDVGLSHGGLRLRGGPGG